MAGEHSSVATVRECVSALAGARASMNIVTASEVPEVDFGALEEIDAHKYPALVAPFEAVRQRICPERSNFLSYSYVLRKLTSLIGIKCAEDHDLYFPLLKSREKLYAADRMWKAICAQLNWPFERSM